MTHLTRFIQVLVLLMDAMPDDCDPTAIQLLFDAYDTATLKQLTFAPSVGQVP